MNYITNFVIASGYPACGLEKTYRNKRDDFIDFLRFRHGVCVKVYNLCIEEDRQYEQTDLYEFGLTK